MSTPLNSSQNQVSKKPVIANDDSLANATLGNRPVTPALVIKTLKDRIEAVSEQVIGREELLTQTLLALLTREHQLLFSRAGTAKSLYANTVYSQFADAQVFKIQMTKGTPEEALVGAVNIEEFKKGNIVHNTGGSIVDAKLGFIDEIFDGNDVALRALLGILNERTFTKGKQHVNAPLHMVVAATNYLRSTDVTEAIIDRFLFRATLLPDVDPFTMLEIDEAYEKSSSREPLPIAQRIPFKYIEQLADIVEGKHPKMKIECPPHVLFMKNNIILEYSQLINDIRLKSDRPEVYISPRRIAKSRDILNAAALLDGRQEVSPKDLLMLRYLIPTLGNPEEQKCFAKAIENVANSISKEDRQAVDLFAKAENVAKKLYDMAKRGEKPDITWFERIKVFFGWTTLSELSFTGLEKTVTDTAARDPRAIAVKKGSLKRILSHKVKAEEVYSSTK